MILALKCQTDNLIVEYTEVSPCATSNSLESFVDPKEWEKVPWTQNVIGK